MTRLEGRRDGLRGMPWRACVSTCEREVVELLAAGLTVAQIAERMTSQRATATDYLERAMAVLGLRRRKSWSLRAYAGCGGSRKDAAPSVVVSRETGRPD